MTAKWTDRRLEQNIALLHCIGLEYRINPNWHEGKYFYLLAIFGSDFVRLFFIKNFETFLEVKIYINWVNLTPCKAHSVLEKMPLDGTKEEHFSCVHSSCQLGLTEQLKVSELNRVDENDLF